MNNPGLRQRVRYGFLLFSMVNFFLLLALAIYSYHYSEDRTLTRLVASTPAVWREYSSIDEMPEPWRDQIRALEPGTHELSEIELPWPSDIEVHVHVFQTHDARSWRILQFDEEPDSIEFFRDYALFALLAAGLLVAFGGWAAWIIANRVSRPLEQLVQAVHQYKAGAGASSFNFAARDGEVALLGNTLNGAFARIDAAMQRERTLAGNISHELRTPLTVISTSLHGADDPDRRFRTEALNRAKRACGEMELLTAACLELGRDPDDRGSESVHAEELVNVADATKQIVRESLHLIGDRGINVDVSVEMNDSSILAKKSLVRLAVGNAVRNALIHGEAGHVQITVTEDSLTIENPVDPRNEPRRWRENYGGNGYGLNILGQACKRLGWQVRFAEKSPGSVIVSFVFAST